MQGSSVHAIEPVFLLLLLFVVVFASLAASFNFPTRSRCRVARHAPAIASEFPTRGADIP
jgi:hypothetical protein